MKLNIEKMFTDFEEGKVTRRQLVFALTALAGGAAAAPKIR